MKGVFLDRATIDPSGVDFSQLDQVIKDWQYFGLTSNDQILNHLGRAEVAVTNKVPLNRGIIENAPFLKCICVSATGTDHVDLAAAKERSIVVCNVRHYCTQAVIQHTFGLTISLMSRLLDFEKAVRAGEWSKSPIFCLPAFETQELDGKTFGIVGFGATGQGVAKVAEAFGMRVLISEHKDCSPEKIRSGREDFYTVLRESDVLSLHCPLNPETKHLISKQELAQMKKAALLINVARGGLIDEAALLKALQAGQIKGAGFDVLAHEPPAIQDPLLSLPNVIITPHVAWNSVQSRQRLVNEIALNIQSYSSGNIRNQVNL